MTRATRRAPARESDTSLLFFAQGERNAEEDQAAYARQVADSQRRRRRRRWIVGALAALVAVGSGVFTVFYLQG